MKKSVATLYRRVADALMERVPDPALLGFLGALEESAQYEAKRGRPPVPTANVGLFLYLREKSQPGEKGLVGAILAAEVITNQRGLVPMAIEARRRARQGEDVRFDFNPSPETGGWYFA